MSDQEPRIADEFDGSVVGALVWTTRNPPTYSMQLMLAVFDFPEWSTGDDADAVPEFWIDYVRQYLNRR